MEKLSKREYYFLTLSILLAIGLILAISAKDIHNSTINNVKELQKANCSIGLNGINYCESNDSKQAQIENRIISYVNSQGYTLDFYSKGEKRFFALSKNPFINGTFFKNQTQTNITNQTEVNSSN